jgi:hypothetical protein
MYEKPELTLVGEVPAVVLGPVNIDGDNEGLPFENMAGLVHGLDD